MNKPSTSRRPRRTRTAPPVQPVRIADWKKQHGIEDIPGGIVPKGFQSATVYFFRHPEQLYDGLEMGELRLLNMTSSWPEENIQKGDRLVVYCGPVQVGQLVLVKLTYTSIVSRLISRDARGKIEIKGSCGKVFSYRLGAYELIGPVVDFPDAFRRLTK